MNCARCNSQTIAFNGRYRSGRQRYKCNDCKKQMSERTGSVFYRSRIPEFIIKIMVLLNIFNQTKIACLLLFLLFRCRVSEKSVNKWTRKFLSSIPDVYIPNYPEGTFLILHADEKFVKIKKEWAYQWNIADCFGNILSSIITMQRDSDSAEKLFKIVNQRLRRLKMKVMILVTDGLQSYIKAKKIFGRQCKHIRSGLQMKMFMHKKRLFCLNNNQAESINARSDYFIKRFQNSFENIESANLWNKSFMLTRILQQKYAENSLRTFSMLDNHENLRELSVLVQR